MSKTQRLWVGIAWVLLVSTAAVSLVIGLSGCSAEADSPSELKPPLDPLDPYNEKSKTHQFCYANGVCCYHFSGYGNLSCVATHLYITAQKQESWGTKNGQEEGEEVTRRAIEARINKEIDAGGIDPRNTLQ